MQVINKKKQQYKNIQKYRMFSDKINKICEKQEYSY